MYVSLTLSVYKKKWKVSVLTAITQKQIFIKIIWWWEPYKTLMSIGKDSCGMVLVSPIYIYYIYMYI